MEVGESSVRQENAMYAFEEYDNPSKDKTELERQRDQLKQDMSALTKSHISEDKWRLRPLVLRIKFALEDLRFARVPWRVTQEAAGVGR